jgi:L-seryl-tRNA(Ser) seleniumtransferase
MIRTKPEELKACAEALAKRLRTLPELAEIEVESDHSFAGGGSLPDEALPTWVVAIRPKSLSDEELSRRLRLSTPAVLSRKRDGRVILDLRTVFQNQKDVLFEAIRTALHMATSVG